MVGQSATLRPSAVIGTASGNAAPRKRCATIFFHPCPFCTGPVPFFELLSRFPTDPPCRMGRVSFGPLESCSIHPRSPGLWLPWAGPAFAAGSALVKSVCYHLKTKSMKSFQKITYGVKQNYPQSSGRKKAPQ